MAVELEQILDRMKKGESPDALLFSFLPAEEQRAIDACALCRSFDRALFDELLCPAIVGHGAAISFDRIVQHTFVEAARRGDGSFRISPSIRRERLVLLFRGKVFSLEQIRSFAEMLADAYAARKSPDAELECVYHTLVFDPEVAIVRLEELFHAAEERFELTRCADLLALVDDPDRPLELREDLRDRVDMLRGIFNARFQWAAEFYKTARYLERQEVEEQARALLEDSERWIRRISEKGGMGKTAFVRWLIARRAVPARIPCARIDFDFVKREESTPRHLLLRIATELDAQMTGSPFREMLASVGERQRRKSASLDDPESLRSLAAMFARAIAETQTNAPILIILDTIEEALLHQGADLLGLIAALAPSRDKNPHIRLLISGRYDLIERIPAFEAGFGKASAKLVIPPFLPEDARRYFALKRDIAEGSTKEEAIAAAIDKADGSPFKLSLLADLFASDPTISAETINTYPSADLLYLIERVVERLPNEQLRWVLRYGVIPRALSRAFVAEVMLPELQKAMAGASKSDDPQKGIEQIQTRGLVFRTDLLRSSDEAIDVDALWRELSRYASSASWVTPGTEPDTLVFHNEVREPMRDLLREQPIFTALHERASRYFEARADNEPAQWARWMREAIYHRFQLEGEAAADHVRACLTMEALGGRPDYRRAILLELGEREIVDAEGRPRRRPDGTAMIDLPTLLEAQRALARACVELAEQSEAGASAFWDEAERALVRARALEKELGLEGSARPELALVEAPIRLHRGDAKAAAEILRPVLAEARDDRQRVALWRSYAEALSALGRSSARGYFQRALVLAERSGEGPRVCFAIRQRLARELLAWDGPSRVVELFDEPHEIAEIPSEARAPIALLLAEARIRDGQAERALEELSQPIPGLAPLDLLTMSARASIALGDPGRCLRTLEEASSLIERSEAGPQRFRRMAEHAELRGRALLAQGELDPAIGAFYEADKLFVEAGALPDAQRCLLRVVHGHLWDTGRLREAEHALDRIAAFELRVGSDAWVDAGLARAELVFRQGQEDEAAAILAERAAAPWLPPRNHIAVALAMLAHGIAIENAYRMFGRALRRIPSPTARLHALGDLRNLPSLPPPPPSLSARISALFADLERIELAPRDHLLARLRAAELGALLGRRDEATELATRGGRELLARGSETLLLLIDVQRIAARLGIESVDWDAAWSMFDAEFGTHRTLVATLLVQRIEARLACAAPPEGIQALGRQAEELLSLSGAPTLLGARLQTALAKLDEDGGRKELAESRGARTEAIFRELGDRPRRFSKRASRAYPRDYLSIFGESMPMAMASPPEMASPSDDEDESAEAASVEETVLESVPSHEAPERIELRIAPDPSFAIVVERRTFPGGARTREVFRERQFPSSEEISSPAFLDRLLEDVQGFAQMLGRLFSLDALRSSAETRAKLCLVLRDRELAALPWELASRSDGTLWSSVPTIHYLYRTSGSEQIPPRAELAWVQTSLSKLLEMRIFADGIDGPLTRRAISRFQAREGLPPSGKVDTETCLRIERALRAAEGFSRPVAIILKPGAAMRMAAQRNFDKSADIGWDYERAGFNARVSEDPDPRAFETLAQGSPPAVIHISASLKDEGSFAGVSLDFASEWRQQQRSYRDIVSGLTPAELHRVIVSARRGAPKPLVILDVPPARGRMQMLRQIFLRNVFAAELFSLGSVAGVLATMLQPVALGNLLHGLQKGAGMGDLARILRGSEGGPRPEKRFEELLFGAATALFTEEP